MIHNGLSNKILGLNIFVGLLHLDINADELVSTIADSTKTAVAESEGY